MESVVLTLLLNTVILLGAINVMSTKLKRLNTNIENLERGNKDLSAKINAVFEEHSLDNESISTKINCIDVKQDLLTNRLCCLTDNLLDNAFEIKIELEENKKYHIETRKVIIDESVKELDKHHAKLVANPPRVYFLDGGTKPNVQKNRK